MNKHLRLLIISLFIAAGGLLAFRPGAQTNTAAPKTNPRFLFLSDVHLDTRNQSTEYGGDTGMDLWRAFLKKVDEILSGPDAPSFIVCTGDLPSHYLCLGSCYLAPGSKQREHHTADVDTMIAALNGLAARYHKPVFYLPGNNDPLAGDYYSFADKMQQTPLSHTPTSPYFFPNKLRTGNAVPCMVSDPNPGLGFYSATPIKGLRMVALNTVIYNAKFTAVDGTNQQNDGNIQMAWLAAQLAEATAKKEKVYIAMHVPPGLDAYSGRPMWVQQNGKSIWLNSFLRLATRYQGTIAGILYGHTHMDELRRLYDSTGTTVTAIAISCPGVTPQHKNNPGFKTVQYDAQTMEMTDFTTYYTYPSATSWGNNTYTFSATYGIVPGTTIRSRLTAMSHDSISNCMGNTYTVKNGTPSGKVAKAIDVKWE